MTKIKVMIVDDSAAVRETLKDIFDADPQIEVVASAADPYIAAEQLKHVIPDVITLDIEMPRMNGLTFLKKIMAQHPIPVVICSSYVGEGSEILMQALELGAVGIIQKPKVGSQVFLKEARVLITDAVKSVAQLKPHIKNNAKNKGALQARQKLSADVMLEKPAPHVMLKTTEKIIVIGASMGGTKAIREVLQAMPLDCPGIVVVQHMPEGFTQHFAEHLNSLCNISVKEAKDGDTVLTGQALIAPGNKHTLIKRSGARYYVEIKAGPLVSRHCPSVDVLFRSAARYAGANVVSAILTGMGDDGAQGMKELFDAGAWTCAQDETSSAVYGMPKEAVLRGGTNRILPLNKIAGALLHACQ